MSDVRGSSFKAKEEDRNRNINKAKAEHKTNHIKGGEYAFTIYRLLKKVIFKFCM